MKKIALFCCAIVLYTTSYFAASVKTQQISGASIQFNCIPALDTIIAGIPSIITSATMDLTNACNSLAFAAQAYEDAADACSDMQTEADYYFNAAQAFLMACNLVLTTNSNLGQIGEAQNIAYIQSYRCSALQSFNQSFQAYLALCFQNANTPAVKSIAANATLALSDFLVNLIALNTQQQNILKTLEQGENFASYAPLYQSNTTCNITSWYPIQLPNEVNVNCPNAPITIPANTTQYSGIANIFNTNPYNNSNYLRERFNFPASQPDTADFISLTQGTPAQFLLNEYPTFVGEQNDVTKQSASHNQGMLSNSNPQSVIGSYFGNAITNATVYAPGVVPTPLYDMSGLGIALLSYTQVLDPYSIHDPKNDSSSSSYDANFANIISIIPQPQYIFTSPAPTTVQTLHDAIRDYMYSADIYKLDSYLYNTYANLTAKINFPEDILPAITRMGNARFNTIECYEGAILKSVVGLTGNTSIAPSSWTNLSENQQTYAYSAAVCIMIILPMYTAMIQQIINYDLPLLNALSSLASSSSENSTASQSIQTTQAAQQASAESAQQSSQFITDLQNAQTAYQKAQTDQSTNQQAVLATAANQQAAQALAQQIQQIATTANTSATQAQGFAKEAADEVSSAQSSLQEATNADAAGQSAFATAQQAYNQAVTAAGQSQQAADQATAAAQQAAQATSIAAAQAAAATAQTQNAAAQTAQQQVEGFAVTAIHQAQAAAQAQTQLTATLLAQGQAAQATAAQNVLTATQQVAQQMATYAGTYAQQAQNSAQKAQQAATLAAQQATQAAQAAGQVASIMAQQSYTSAPTPAQQAADTASMQNQYAQSAATAAANNAQQVQTAAQQAATAYQQAQKIAATATTQADIDSARALSVTAQAASVQASQKATIAQSAAQNASQYAATALAQAQAALAAQPAPTITPQQNTPAPVVQNTQPQPAQTQTTSQVLSQNQQAPVVQNTQPQAPAPQAASIPQQNMPRASIKTVAQNNPAPAQTSQDQPDIQNIIAQLFAQYEKQTT